MQVKGLYTFFKNIFVMVSGSVNGIIIKVSQIKTSSFYFNLYQVHEMRNNMSM